MTTASPLVLELKPELSQLEHVEPWLQQADQAWALGEELVYKLNVCIEEWFSNLVQYGVCLDEPQNIFLRLERTHSETILQVTDYFQPFDPTQLRAPAAAESLETAEIGGQGIHLMASFSHYWHYQSHEQQGNQLILHLR